MLTSGEGNRFYNIDTKLHGRPGIQSQAAAAIVTMDTDTNTSLKDKLVRTLIPNNRELTQGRRRRRQRERRL